MPTKDHTTSTHIFNPNNPATWLKPDEPLVGADGRDWSWCYVWHKDIDGFPDYKVGADGSIWSRKPNPVGRLRGDAFAREWRRLKPCRFGKTSHRQVTLCRGRERRYSRIHRIVLEAFVGPCPPGMECCHFPDGDARNNRLENLRWATNKDNKKDMVAHGTRLSGEAHPMASLSDEEVRSMRVEREAGSTLKELSDRYRVSDEHVGSLVRGRLRVDAGGPIQDRRRPDRPPDFGPHNPRPGVEYREIDGFPGYMIGSDQSLWTCRLNSGRMGGEWWPLKILERGKSQRIACLDNGRRKQIPMYRLMEKAFGAAV